VRWHATFDIKREKICDWVYDRWYRMALKWYRMALKFLAEGQKLSELSKC